MRQGGLTSIVPVGGLEREVEVKITAATADDDTAGREQWALPNKTRVEADAREVLRWFAARWWRYFQEKQATHYSMPTPHSKMTQG